LDQPTYYQHLRDVGYHVLGVGKFDLSKNTLEWGLNGKRLIDEWGFSDGIDNEGKYDGARSGKTEPHGPYLAYLYERGLAQAHLEDFDRSNRHGFHDTHPTKLPDDAYCDNWIVENGLRLLDEAPKENPWHLVINFTGPHNPMDITQSMYDARPKVKYPSPVESSELNPNHHNEIRRNYGATIENIDRQVGRFIQAVEARGELDNTLIVYSSDHGEMLGDHDRWGKSVPYQPSAGVPLVIAGPGVEEGLETDTLVEIQDLAGTFLDVAGAEALPDSDTKSLVPVLLGEVEAHREFAVSALGDWRSVWDGQYKLVEQKGQELTLFNLVADPGETRDLAKENDAEVERLRGILDDEIG
jgi:arylsulfatase A-like enzyme